ncbi:MAG: hypothetical protein LUB59_03940, partial [Candidatus Gastranaerophilales bacterium]|nr:hypothetical protein [Candidatus Gastranaerophilales bacterium]
MNMTAVSGATSSSNTDYTTLIKQGSSTFSNCTGIDTSKYSTAIGFALNGDASKILSSAGSEIGAAIGGDVGAAIGEGIGDIVAAVLSGKDVSGEDKKAIEENENQLNQNADLVNNLADSGSAETEEISETAKSEMEGAKVTIDDSANTITIENENTEAITIDIT